MSDLMLVEPVELTDAELDLVTGGQAGAAGGLVNLALNLEQIDILRGSPILNNVSVLDNNTVTIRDVANANRIGVGAIISVLGGPAGILQGLA